MNFIILDYFFLILFSLYKLISLVDNCFIFSNSGSRLSKYIDKNDQQKLTCNFDIAQSNFKFIYSVISFIKSPKIRKHYFYILLATLSTVALKIAITYKFLFSNFFYLNIFLKNFDLVSILGDKYIFFICIYYALSTFFILVFYSKIIKMFRKDNSTQIVKKENEILLGNDMSNNSQVYITYEGLYQNVLITGSIGSGKTSSAISTLLDEMLNNNIYGLIIDVKGNYIDTVRKMAIKYNKLDRLCVISMENNFKYNPLNKPELSSVELSNYMIRVLKVLSNSNSNTDPFWLDKAESFIRDFITLIRIYNDGLVNFMEIHKLVTDNSYIDDKILVIKEKILNNEFCNEKLFAINSAINNIKNEYMKLDDKIIGVIKSEITRLTNVFVTDYKIYEKFCIGNDKLNFLENNIVVLSIDIGKNRALSKIISTYLKLDFQQQILSRKEKNYPVFFVCDEFQEVVNIEDSNFFALSREYKAINIISVQSYNSLINSLKDNRSANVIIQNLVNKIWFRNDDSYTIKEIIKQVGKEEKNIKSLSYTENGQNSKYNIINKKFKDYKIGLSKSLSFNFKEEYKFSEEYFSTKLNTFEAACFVSDGNKIRVIEKVKFKRWGEVYENK